MRCALLVLLLSLSVSTSADNAVYSAIKEISGSDLDRYVLVSGNSLVSPIEKLKEHGELAHPSPSIFYEFEVARIGLWTVFKLPGTASHWMHHNITYWFLGWGEDDPNYADTVIGLATHKNGTGYVIYGTNEYSVPQDSLYGQMSNGASFIVNIPFDELAFMRGSMLPQPPSIVRGLKLPGDLEFSKISIEYHETLDQVIH